MLKYTNSLDAAQIKDFTNAFQNRNTKNNWEFETVIAWFMMLIHEMIFVINYNLTIILKAMAYSIAT